MPDKNSPLQKKRTENKTACSSYHASKDQNVSLLSIQGKQSTITSLFYHFFNNLVESAKTTDWQMVEWETFVGNFDGVSQNVKLC